MKKTTKQTTSKTKGTRATKNLEVKLAKGGAVRGGAKLAAYVEEAYFRLAQQVAGRDRNETTRGDAA